MDARVRLRVAGDADVGERRAEVLEVLEQRQGVGVGADGLRVAAGHEDGGDAGRGEPRADLLELGAAAHHPGGEVRHGGVAGLAQPLGEVEGDVEALGRRRGDGDGAVDRHVGQHLLLGAGRGQHLVARALEQPDQRVLDFCFVAHEATRFVIRTDVGSSLNPPRPAEKRCGPELSSSRRAAALHPDDVAPCAGHRPARHQADALTHAEPCGSRAPRAAPRWRCSRGRCPATIVQTSAASVEATSCSSRARPTPRPRARSVT